MLEGVAVAVHRDWWRWLRWLQDGVMSESGWRLPMWRLGLCGDAEVVLGGCLSRDRERSRNQVSDKIVLWRRRCGDAQRR